MRKKETLTSCDAIGRCNCHVPVAVGSNFPRRHVYLRSVLVVHRCTGRRHCCMVTGSPGQRNRMAENGVRALSTCADTARRSSRPQSNFGHCSRQLAV